MTTEQTLVSRHFVSSGYYVDPTSNGGFIVRKREERSQGMRMEEAAFTTAADLLAFLQAGHGVEPKVESITKAEAFARRHA